MTHPLLAAPVVLALSATLCLADAGKIVHDALYTEEPVVVDGKLDEAIWSRAKAYPLNVAWKRGAEQHALNDGGTVWLAWDENYLYLAAKLDDPDVIAENDADQAHHYRDGDVMELFLRPPGKRHYWELYGTPNSKKTAFFFPSRGRGFLPSSSRDPLDLKVAATVDGTLNEWQDRDNGWTLEMAVPLKGLTALGDKAGEGAEPWRLLIARYNYSVYHEIRGGEFSTTSPSFENADFHNFDVWSELRFVKEAGEE